MSPERTNEKKRSDVRQEKIKGQEGCNLTVTCYQSFRSGLVLLLHSHELQSMTNKRMMKLMVYNQFPVIFIELPGKKKKN